MPSSPKPPPARRSRTTLAVPRIEPAEPTSDPKLSMRQRIMQAAHSLLMEQGYGVSTLRGRRSW